MGIARSSFYAVPSPGADDTALVEAMHAVKDNFEAYGWRRMQAALRRVGWVVNHKKVKRLMREHGLNPEQHRRLVATTDSDHDQPIFPDRTRGLAPVSSPNRLRVVDLPYVAVSAGFVYVALIMDAWSRRIVGYAIGRRTDARLPSRPRRRRSGHRLRHRVASIIRIADRSMQHSPTATGRQWPVSKAPWGAAAIPGTPQWPIA